MKPKVLVAEDEQALRETCSRLLQRMGFSAFAAASGTEAIALGKEHDIGMAILDIKMPGKDGIEVLRELKKLKPESRVIIITGFPTVESAVEAMKLGASDYVVKDTETTSLAQMEDIIRRTFGNPLDRSESAIREDEFYGLVGRSPVMLELRRLIELVAPSDVPALIVGETGTGKELVARAIHRLSPRASEPFVPIDCSVIGERIAESELFGHKRGAFTDAVSDRTGLLQAAGKGTVFLDEITNIPLDVQAKLLRTLQEKVIRPIGSEETRPLEARLLAASNRDLKEAVSQGTFRDDLFYRLHVIPITVAPLREKKEDVAPLVRHFVRKHGRRGAPPVSFDDAAVGSLASYDWPGNVRELESFVRMVITVSPQPSITKQEVDDFLKDFAKSPKGKPDKVLSLEEAEKKAIISALAAAGGDKRKAAKMLGLALSTLYRKMKRFDIKR